MGRQLGAMHDIVDTQLHVHMETHTRTHHTYLNIVGEPETVWVCVLTSEHHYVQDISYT